VTAGPAVDRHRAPDGSHTEAAMALRSYTDGSGGEWRVWRVVPDSISFSTLGESYRDGWLCFERVDGTDRRRLSMTHAPSEWETLSDDRLDLLRRQAEPATRRPSSLTSESGVREQEKRRD
jgi:hypothetical protein